MSAAVGVSRAPVHLVPRLYVELPDGTRLYVCNLPLRGGEYPLTIVPQAMPEALHWNIGAALTIYQRALNHVRESFAPTTTDGESHLTDEDVLAEVAESQERARVQLYGGAL